jgi:hypothetical protein
MMTLLQVLEKERMVMVLSFRPNQAKEGVTFRESDALLLLLTTTLVLLKENKDLILKKENRERKFETNQ